MESSVSWEKVMLSPVERFEAEVQATQNALQSCQVAQNSRGVDLDANGVAIGKIVIDVLEAKGFKTQDSTKDITSLYFSVSITPSTNAAGKKVAKVPAKGPWHDPLEFDKVKSKKMSIKVALREKSDHVADKLLGEVSISMVSFYDQEARENWFELKPALASQSKEESIGQLCLRIKFEYDYRKRLEAQIKSMEIRQAELKERAIAYEKTQKALQAHARHPASYGDMAAKLALNIPGNRFMVMKDHPAAVVKTPIADKTRVVTPFGKGTVQSFRSIRKIYVVRLDPSTDQAKPATGYFHEDVVKEETIDDFQVGNAVSTPYGDGKIVEIRQHDFVVDLKYGRSYIRKEEVKVPAKKVTDMSIKELVLKADELTAKGNTFYKESKHVEAVQSYLQSLGYLQHVNQENATHKEKAMVLKTMVRCHLNIGACKLKLEAFSDVITSSTNAINILSVIDSNKTGKVVEWMGKLGVKHSILFKEWPTKALYRRAQACIHRAMYKEAKADLTYVLHISPEHKQAKSKLEWVCKKIASEKQKEKKTWGGIFEKGADVPAPATSKPAVSEPISPTVTYEAPPKTSPGALPSAIEIPVEKADESSDTWSPVQSIAAAAVAIGAVAMMVALSKKT